MNTIRQQQTGEPAGVRRSLDAVMYRPEGVKDTEAHLGAAGVVGGSRSGKDCVVNAGDLPGQEDWPTSRPAEVRAAIVAQASREESQARNSLAPGLKPGNAGEAKGGRKANPTSNREREASFPSVPLPADKQGKEDLWQSHGAERGVWSEGMLLALQRGIKGNRWFSLIDKVYAERTLAIAWEKVRANAGACGADGITIERFHKDSQKRLLAVREQILEGSYVPTAVKRVWIPKPGSPEKRPLGIPTVRDRVVQTALRMVLEPIFEREFAPQSYGFRPGRSCKDALGRVEELLRKGQVQVVDIDIQGYFDHIPHERLLALVAERVADGRVLGLVEAFLKQGIMEAMKGSEAIIEEAAAEEGTPQGGVISPLLANIYLNPLDWLMSQAGVEMVRYADDMVVLCKSREEAEEALKRIESWMSEAGLTLHPQKTRIVDMSVARSHFDFLGYRFWRGKNGKVLRLVRPKSRKKLRQTLKPQTRRANGDSLEAILRKINPTLKGWYGYFKHACASELKGVDQWVRARLRAILRKRQGRRGRSGKSDHLRWKNCYFDQLGLFSLEQARALELNSLRLGAKCAY